MTDALRDEFEAVKRVRLNGMPDLRCKPNAKKKRPRNNALVLPQPNASDYESQRRHSRLRALGWTICYADDAIIDAMQKGEENV